jgi:hypothetical protein
MLIARVDLIADVCVNGSANDASLLIGCTLNSCWQRRSLVPCAAVATDFHLGLIRRNLRANAVGSAGEWFFGFIREAWSAQIITKGGSLTNTAVQVYRLARRIHPFTASSAARVSAAAHAGDVNPQSKLVPIHRLWRGELHGRPGHLRIDTLPICPIRNGRCDRA